MRATEIDEINLLVTMGFYYIVFQLYCDQYQNCFPYYWHLLDERSGEDPIFGQIWIKGSVLRTEGDLKFHLINILANFKSLFCFHTVSLR